MQRGLTQLKIMIKGAGEMATGTACRLHSAGFNRILMTEVEFPLAVRRMVSFSEAVHDRSQVVEGIKAIRADSFQEASAVWANRVIPVLVDPDARCREQFEPDVVVDAILAKENLGTTIRDAALVIGLGPGFSAGSDVHCVIETNRGHNLGRLIMKGPASPNTGVPGDIAGQTATRVLRAPTDGAFRSDLSIGVMVERGRVVAHVDGAEVRAGLDGVLRGLIRPGTRVWTGLKIGDVDPRGDPSYCHTISEKARAIGGSVLEAILMKFNT